MKKVDGLKFIAEARIILVESGFTHVGDIQHGGLCGHYRYDSPDKTNSFTVKLPLDWKEHKDVVTVWGRAAEPIKDLTGVHNGKHNYWGGYPNLSGDLRYFRYYLDAIILHLDAAVNTPSTVSDATKLFVDQLYDDMFG